MPVAYAAALSTLIISLSFFYFLLKKKEDEFKREKGVSEASIKSLEDKVATQGREISSLQQSEKNLQKQIEEKLSEIKDFKKKEEDWIKGRGDYLILENKSKDKDEEIKRLKEREEQWQEFSRGYSLEQMIAKRDEFYSNRKKLKGETKNAGLVGAKLEESTKEVLNSLFPKHLPNTVKWEHQKIMDSELGTKDRADFVLEFFNSKLSGNFKVLLECKSQIDDDESEYMLVEDEKKKEEYLKKGKKQIVKGIKQLIEYSEKERPNLCLLLTTSKFDKGNLGFSRFSWREYGIEKKSSYPEIFLVSSLESLSVMLIIISSLSSAYDPTISLSQNFDEWLKDDYIKFLSTAGETTKEAREFMDRIRKKSGDAEKILRHLNKWIGQLFSNLEKREAAVMDFVRSAELSPHKETLKLEGSRIVESELDYEGQEEGN